jgi:hypothetical protein
MQKMTMKIFAPALALALAFAQQAVAQQSKPATLLPAPCPVEVVKGDNWRGKPHYEVLFMNRDAKGPGGSGNYYNSLGQSFTASNAEMDARFRAIDPVKLKKEYGSDGIRFNGPRRFMANGYSGLAFDGCKQRVFDSIPMFLYGTFFVPDFDAFIIGKVITYRETVSKRTSTFYYNAGEQVYELITPKGVVYTMFSASLKVDPNNTVDRLPMLAERLKLPEGWKFRVRTLEKDLALSSAHDSVTPNTVVFDDFENNYQINRN